MRYFEINIYTVGEDRPKKQHVYDVGQRRTALFYTLDDVLEAIRIVTTFRQDPELDRLTITVVDILANTTRELELTDQALGEYMAEEAANSNSQIQEC